MIEKDTIKLLRECDAGIKMGVSSIEEVLEYVKDNDLKKYLADCKDEHNKLDKELQERLNTYHDDGKEPNPVEKDTIKLLRECDAGVKMGVSAIDEVMDYVESKELKKELNACKDEHDKLAREIEEQLARFQDDGKEPNPMAKGMSWMKTNIKLVMDESDNTIADLITDGCNMGVKTLNRYLNQYQAADEVSKDICKRLINLEEELAIDIRRFL